LPVAAVEKKPVKKLPPRKTSEVLSVTIEQLQLVRYLQQPELTLQRAFGDLLRRWQLPAVNHPDCAQLPLNCLADKASWPELIALQRPAIMEFPVNINEKRFLLLIAVKNGQPVFANENTEISFPLQQVLSLWQGNYLLLWQSPHAKVEVISPHQQSPAVVWLREQLDLQEGVSTQVRSTDYFDDTLQAKVLAFQQSQQLRADGIAGPRTIIHLQNHNKIDNVTKLKITD
jgi:general secretion pathway protein A